MSYDLNKQIDTAWYEVDKLENPTFPQINLTARKYSPYTIKEIKELLLAEENTWTLALPAQAGRLVEDVIAASVAEYIAGVLFHRLQQKAQEKVEQVKMQSMRDAVTTKKGQKA